jgi:hypothetical protein
MSVDVSSASLGCDRMPRPLSFTGRRWVEPDDDAGAVALATNLGVTPLVGRCLARRVPSGIVGRSWMTPDLADLHDPFLMANMDVAVERVRRAVDRGEHVRIVTDYDVDGTTSSLILQETLRIQGARSGGTGAKVDYHIPHRFHEGYGFSAEAARRAVDEGVQLIVTADIGVRDHDAVTARGPAASTSSSWITTSRPARACPPMRPPCSVRPRRAARTRTGIWRRAVCR